MAGAERDPETWVRKMARRDDMLVKLAEFANPWDGEFVRGLLSGVGISSALWFEGGPCSGDPLGGRGPVSILIPFGDIPKALGILGSVRATSEGPTGDQTARPIKIRMLEESETK